MASWGVTPPPTSVKGTWKISQRRPPSLNVGGGRFGDEQDTQHSPFSFLLPMLPPDAG